MSAALDLSEVDTHALVAEMERRLECATKPEKRVILIGETRATARLRESRVRCEPAAPDTPRSPHADGAAAWSGCLA